MSDWHPPKHIATKTTPQPDIKAKKNYKRNPFPPLKFPQPFTFSLPHTNCFPTIYPRRVFSVPSLLLLLLLLLLPTTITTTTSSTTKYHTCNCLRSS